MISRDVLTNGGCICNGNYLGMQGYLLSSICIIISTS